MQINLVNRLPSTVTCGLKPHLPQTDEAQSDRTITNAADFRRICRNSQLVSSYQLCLPPSPSTLIFNFPPNVTCECSFFFFFFFYFSFSPSTERCCNCVDSFIGERASERVSVSRIKLVKSNQITPQVEWKRPGRLKVIVVSGGSTHH